MSKRLMILDGSIYPELYRPTEHWRRLAAEVPSDSFHLPSGEAPVHLEGYSHVILTGSETCCAADEPWFALYERVIREGLEKGTAILGSCFGHQMLARVLSGAEHVRATPTPEVGWIRLTKEGRDELLADVPASWHAFASHFDEVTKLGAPWRVLAHSPACAVHAMRYGDERIWGLQAHPEIAPKEARDLMRGLMMKMPDKAEVLQAALEEEPRDDGVARRIMERFLSCS